MLPPASRRVTAATTVSSSGFRSGPSGTRMAAPLPSSASTRSRRPLAEPPAVASGLSAYPLMELRRTSGTHSGGRGLGGGAVGSHAWLSACVRHIVTTAGAPDTSQPGGAAAAAASGGRGPSLHLVFSGPGGASHSFQSLPLSHAVADNPQNWDQIAATVSRTGANGLVLVRPIPSPDQHCVFAAAASSASSAAAAASPAPAPAAATASDSPCSPASPSSSCCSPSSACSPNGVLLPPPPACPTASMEGDVGDCCGGSGSSGHSHDHSPPSSGSAAAPATPKPTPTPCGCPHTRYYGVVVQGATPSDTDGCWVLKTSRSDAGSQGPAAHGVCTCTHFTLTRVCGGTPLYSQLRDAWLVPQQQQQQQQQDHLQQQPAGSSSAGQQQQQLLWH